jgi:hypothetical protein
MATNWVTVPTVASLNDFLVGAQVTAINTAALAVGQTDRFTQVRDTVVARVRSYVESGGQQLSLTAKSVPPELLWVVCWLVIGSLQATIPGLRLTEDQKANIDRAEKELERVLEGKLKVTAASDPLGTANAQAGTGPRVTGRGNVHQWGDQDGV